VAQVIFGDHKLSGIVTGSEVRGNQLLPLSLCKIFRLSIYSQILCLIALQSHIYCGIICSDLRRMLTFETIFFFCFVQTVSSGRL
jgi:hypothetical protein